MLKSIPLFALFWNAQAGTVMTALKEISLLECVNMHHQHSKLKTMTAYCDVFLTNTCS